MLRFVFLGLTFLLIGCGTVEAASVAVVKYVQGQVKVKHSGSVKELAEGDELASGDLLITGSDGAIGIVFSDGSLLSLQKNSYFKIRRYRFNPLKQQFDIKLFLKHGGALFESGKIGTLAPDKFLFEIPSGTIGIRGTKFLVEVK